MASDEGDDALPRAEFNAQDQPTSTSRRNRRTRVRASQDEQISEQHRGNSTMAPDESYESDDARPLARTQPRSRPNRRGQPSRDQQNKLAGILKECLKQLHGNRDVKPQLFRKTKQCRICNKYLANSTTLFRHYRCKHLATDEKMRSLGYNINSNVIDISLPTDNSCSTTDVNKMHKCVECAGYFEERNKLDEHVKVQHGDKNKEKNEKVVIQKTMRNTEGYRVLVFYCTKCDIKMVDSIDAGKHARDHKKGLKIKVAPRAKVSKADDYFILTCQDCNISTGSYDAAVKHAQDHMTNNLNDIVIRQCPICTLKFDRLCYKNHDDLHYKNKELHKESFRYFKYNYMELIYEQSFYTESELKKTIDESIYQYTRNVIMRASEGGTYNLYKCCQCNNFIEPASVLNHTINFDTCVKLNCSYTCNICERKFNNRLARYNHAKDHKSEESYKTVLFNHEKDKKFNKILNKINDEPDAPKVLYKCLCGLCFVRKVKADVHIKICTGKEPRKSCSKCNIFFNPGELVDHYFENHSDQTQIVIVNVTPDSPDIIVISSDEESEKNKDDTVEKDSSDKDNDGNTKRLHDIVVKVMVHADGDTVTGSSEETKKQNMNALDEITEASKSVEKVASEANLLIAKCESENEHRGDDDFRGTDSCRDDDSQGTITEEITVTATDVANPVMNNQEKVQCVSTNLLLNPLHFERNVGVLNAGITTGNETVRQQLETTNAICSIPFDVTDKKEDSKLDPTNLSNIPSNLSQDTVDILTVDEDSLMNHDEDVTETNDSILSEEKNDTPNKGSENNHMREGIINKPVSPVPVVGEPTDATLGADYINPDPEPVNASPGHTQLRPRPSRATNTRGQNRQRTRVPASKKAVTAVPDIEFVDAPAPAPAPPPAASSSPSRRATRLGAPVPRVVSLRVSNCSEDTTVEDVVSHVQTHMGISAPVCEQLFTRGDYTSFRIEVPADKQMLVRSRDNWPDGVSVRLYKNNKKTPRYRAVRQKQVNF